MTRIFISWLAWLTLLSPLGAQLATSLTINKKTYIAGEPVIADVTVTNHSGQDLTLASSRALPWLSFVVTDARNNPVGTRKLNAFGAMKIKAGQSLGKKVDLTEYFLLHSQGNFAVSAVIRDPAEKVQPASTNRILFSLNPGRVFWAQKIGVSSTSKTGTREMKVITFINGQTTQLYAQVLDGHTGFPVSTFLLGDALMLRQPKVAVDGKQRMHVMFLATPSIWVHCQVSADGKLVGRDLHQRASQSDPVLMCYGDGSVRVMNSILYDAKAAAEARNKVRKATDRPDIAY